MGRPRVFQESRNLVIRVEMRLHERLTKLAEERDVAVSELVRPLLEELVAGIWSTVHDPSGRPYMTFAILTTEANEAVAQIHNRMPVIVHARDEATWLNQRCPLDEAQALLAPFPADLLMLYEVSPKINSPVYNTPDALHPVVHV